MRASCALSSGAGSAAKDAPKIRAIEATSGGSNFLFFCLKTIIPKTIAAMSEIPTTDTHRLYHIAHSSLSKFRSQSYYPPDDPDRQAFRLIFRDHLFQIFC